ncbi:MULTISPECIES: DUF5819 family protein [unclassified Streptomyces]|uniref:DUF5819 family protein n=1 Tax=unclassified Streptomyces TaxID=2593676 RepID=UPI00037ABB2D|nr:MULTISPECIES: DUF5819 family protein [unclassified Streptomyces]MYY04874.1 hypothetical protein [Streptomyces sp. SID4913]
MDSDDDRGADGISGAAPAVAASTGETSAAGVFAAEVPVAEVPVAGALGAGAGDCEAPVVVGGMAGLSFPYQVAAAVALAVCGVIACVQLAMVFLHVAPSNTLTKQHGAAVDEWIYPEFEQNWKLFAPNPLQQNVAVQVRTELAGPDGPRTTAWTDLSAEDGRAIRGNLLPSHVQQNELRRAWDFYVGSHDDQNRANGLRGSLSERYVRRLVMLRLTGHHDGETILRIQVRSEVRAVAAPEWSDEKISTGPSYRVLPWWKVEAADVPKGTAGYEGADQ